MHKTLKKTDYTFLVLGWCIGEFPFLAGKVDVKDILWQLALGSVQAINPPLWYMVDLIILTALLGLLCLTIKNRKAKTLIIVCLIILAQVLQYTGINYRFFYNLAEEQRYALGRICEMLPYAGIGILIANYRKEGNNKKYFMQIAFLCLFTFSVLRQHTFPPGFFYQGMQLLVSTILIVLVFLMLPLNFFPRKMLTVLKWFSKYTLGIYCVHWSIGKALLKVFAYFQMDLSGKVMCLIIYSTSFLMVLLFSKIPLKLIKKVIF